MKYYIDRICSYSSNMVHVSKKFKTAITAIILDDLTASLLHNTHIMPIIIETSNQPQQLLYWLTDCVQTEHSRIPFYHEEWVDKYIAFDFYRLFRMSRITYEYLVVEIQKMEVVNLKHKRGREEVPLNKSVLMTLWYLGKGETLISISDRFNVTQSAAFRKVHYIIKFLEKLLPKYVLWPNREQCITISNKFLQKSGYPGIIGAIDGCNIKCKVPCAQQDSYLDRKFSHSIKLQAISTSNRLFTNVSIGFPGSVHDARVIYFLYYIT